MGNNDELEELELSIGKSKYSGYKNRTRSSSPGKSSSPRRTQEEFSRSRSPTRNGQEFSSTLTKSKMPNLSTMPGNKVTA